MLLNRNGHTCSWTSNSRFHYDDVIMRAMASQITSLTVVYSIVYSGADKKKKNIKAPRHWPLCGEFTGTGEFPAQRASNAENVSIWWRHRESRSPGFEHASSLGPIWHISNTWIIPLLCWNHRVYICCKHKKSWNSHSPNSRRIDEDQA